MKIQNSEFHRNENNYVRVEISLLKSYHLHIKIPLKAKAIRDTTVKLSTKIQFHTNRKIFLNSNDSTY